jgi:cytochrome c551/c552
VLRSIAELAAYGALAMVLTAASLGPAQDSASSATTGDDTTPRTDAAFDGARGQTLFAVKGCIGCHMHPAFPSARMRIGPDLTGLGARAGATVAGLDAAAYVRQSLREPGAYRAAGAYGVMPDLRLSDSETESLTAFLLSSAP